MREGCNSHFLFWANFCSFTPLTTQETKIFAKMKKSLGVIIILHMCTKNNDHMCTVPEI